MKNVQTVITISEVNGKLEIHASIPDDAEDSIAGGLTKHLVGVAQQTMNQIMDRCEEVVISRMQ